MNCLFFVFFLISLNHTLELDWNAISAYHWFIEEWVRHYYNSVGKNWRYSLATKDHNHFSFYNPHLSILNHPCSFSLFVIIVLESTLKSCSFFSPTEHGINNRTGFYHSVFYIHDLGIVWKPVADIHCLEETWNERSDKFLVRQYGRGRSTSCSISDSYLHGSFLHNWNDWCSRWPVL